MGYPFDCISEFIFVETPIEKADIILIPGGSHAGQMERAAELYHQGYAPYLLPSGGFNKKLGETEWAYFQKIGLNMGVPEAAILKEDQAENTFDNARNSWAVLQSEEIKVNKAIMVCKAQHSRRALMTYQTVFPRDMKMMVTTVGGLLGVTKDNWYLDENRIYWVMKEVEKIGKYFGKHIPNWVD